MRKAGFVNVLLSLILPIIALQTTVLSKEAPNAKITKPLNVVATPLTASSIEVAWEEPLGGASDLDHYEVSWTPPDTAGDSVVDVSDALTCTITQLVPCTNYEIVVSAIGSDNDVAESDAADAETLSAAPSEPLNLECLTLSSREISVTWDDPLTSSCAFIEGFILSYHGTSDYDEQDAGNENFAPSEHKDDLDGLLSYTNYEFSLVAFNSAGNSTAAQKSCRTLEGVPDAPIHLSAKVISNTEVEVSFVPPEVVNGILVNYFVSYEEDKSGTVMEKSYPPDATTVVLDELSGCENYEIIVWCQNGGANSTKTTGVVVKTDVDVPEPVRHAACQTKSAEAIDVSWMIPANNCNLDGYTLSYNGKSILYDDTQIESEQFDADATEANLMNLIVYADYLLTIIATNEHGSSSPVDIGCSTFEGVPDSPTIINTIPTASSILVKWTEPEKIYGVLISYNIFYNVDGEDPVKETCDASETLYVIENLLGCTAYEIIITAENGAEESEPGDPASADTGGKSPEASELSCTPVSDNEISLSWIPYPNGCDILRYSLHYKGVSLYDDIDEDTIIIEAASSSYEMTDLLSYSDYDISLTSFNTYGTSEASDIYCKTLEGVPNSPTGVEALLTSATSVSISWDPVERANGILQNYFVSLKEEENEAETTEYCVPANENSIEIDDLEDCIIFIYSVWAENCLHNSSSNLEDKIATGVTDTPVPIDENCFANDSWIFTNWTTKEDVSSCPFNMPIRWRASILWEQAPNNILEDEDFAVGENQYLMAAVPYTSYNICVGELQQGQNEICKTILTDEAVAGPPQNIRVSQKDDVVHISYSPPEMINGEVSDYQLLFQTGSIIYVDNSTKTDAYYHTNDFVVCNSYNLSVLLINGAGRGESGLIEEPFVVNSSDAPVSITCNCTFPGFIAVNIVSPKSCAPTYYYYSIIGESLWSDKYEELENSIPGQLEHYVFMKTIPYAKYAISFSGDSNMNKMADCNECITPQTAPGPVQNTSHTQYENYVVVTWGAPVDKNGIITGYKISWISSEGIINRKTVPSYVERYVLRNLDECSKVAITISAMTEAGVGTGDTQVLERISTDPPFDLVCDCQQGFIHVDIIPPQSCPPLNYYYRVSGSAMWSDDRVEEEVSTVNGTETAIHHANPIAYATYEVYVSGDKNMERYYKCECNTPEDEPSVVRNVEAKESIGAALVTWVEPEMLNGIITNYIVNWNGGSHTVDAEDTSYSITGLMECTSYTADVSATTSVGPGDAGNTAFRTLTDDPPSKVECDCKEESVTVTLTKEFEDCFPETYYYEFTSEPLWDHSPHSGEESIGGEESQFEISNAIPYSKYSVSVAGGDENSAECSCDTPQAAPSAPVNLETAFTSDDAVGLVWGAPDSIPGEFQTYTVYYTISTSDVVVFKFNTTQTSFSVYGLSPLTAYRFDVTAATKSGGEGPPAELEQTTLKSDNDDDDDDDHNIGAIVGGTLGALVLLLIIAGGVWYYHKKDTSGSVSDGSSRFH